ncbi:hypothetical protein [Acinetobacter baumannii]|uniref:Uncharacterized protein n=1 Tax=Salmonella enterica TaxID=28901 RepID=A0A744X6V7_SALER|nr:hypothetical protein [Acinetobacter baumannii]EDX8187754.1 hypothetical protein [Salmonella enterica subsp. enterica]EDY3930253.1 hypothetical protein [Salmonella enterica]HAF2950810.1 hypothetical protein [Salmonella enterica]HAF4515603.1 hypothetical protein [Salmonella enterica]HEN9576792.1 hypothetical protein [Acinetobacter baumannii]
MSKSMIILAVFCLAAIIAGYHYYRTQTYWIIWRVLTDSVDFSMNRAFAGS